MSPYTQMKLSRPPPTYIKYIYLSEMQETRGSDPRQNLRPCRIIVNSFTNSFATSVYRYCSSKVYVCHGVGLQDLQLYDELVALFGKTLANNHSNSKQVVQRLNITNRNIHQTHKHNKHTTIQRIWHRKTKRKMKLGQCTYPKITKSCSYVTIYHVSKSTP